MSEITPPKPIAPLLSREDREHLIARMRETEKRRAAAAFEGLRRALVPAKL